MRETLLELRGQLNFTNKPGCTGPGRRRRQLLICLGISAYAIGFARGQEELSVLPGSQPQAPPPAIQAEFPVKSPALVSNSQPAAFAGTTLYSIGEPTDEEQLYLEYINRARANPAAQAVWLRDLTDPEVLNAYDYFQVDLNLMVQQISALAPAPPLAMNPRLQAAARLHSGDQLTNEFQGHFGSDGSSPGDRITAQGYNWNRYGENVFAYAKSVRHGHAGFEVDWGGSVGGMQNPPGHRVNIHNAAYREVGIGIVNGSSGSVGPQIVTQDFSARSGQSPLVTGVVYYDFNQNGGYDLGEGLAGVQVDVDGSDYYAISTASGGYAVPVPGNGSYLVRFTSSGLATSEQSIAVNGGQNVKVDCVLAYEPPTISGPNPAMVGVENEYAFTEVGAASGYQWEYAQLEACDWVEGAEAGLGNVAVSASSGYSVIDTGVHASGGASFHLAHPQPANQEVRLNHRIRPGPGSELTFSSRLGWAGAGQVARAQVSTNGGADWTDVFTRSGTGSSGQGSFVQSSISLTAYAGQELEVRFLYEYTGGSYYYQTSSGVGFYFDDVSVSGAEELLDPVVSPATTDTTFSFRPLAATEYGLRVRAQVGERQLDWGPLVVVQASSEVPSVIRMNAAPVFSGDRILLDFTIVQGAPQSFSVEWAPAPQGPWRVDASATFQPLSASAYRASAARQGAVAFYRIGVQ